MSESNIMVVEDSGIVLLDIQKSLKSLGYTVAATASSKNEAIRKADETRPDLVLMDIRLGEEMGGIEAADYIREHYNIPIVFLTGYADEDTFQRAKITDPSGYILKPFDPKGLRTTIEIALHNHKLKSQLYESEKRYRTLVETMNDGVGQVDANGKLIFANDKLCQMTGHSKEELLGREHLTLFANECRELQKKEFEKRRAGEANSFETLLVHKDGSTTPVILSGQPVMDHAGNFVSVIGVFTDITERKRAEEQVRKSKQFLEEAERQVHMGHYEIDIVSGEAVWSEEVFNIFGLSSNGSEPSVEAYQKLIHPDDVEKVYKLYEESSQQGVPFDLVYRIIRPNGEIRYVHSNARTLLDQNSNVKKIFGTFQDVTEIKQVELALQESEERYRTLFENSPIAIWEEDFSAVQEYFDKLRKEGIKNFRDYFEKNPDEVSRLAEQVEITNVNETSVSFFEASSKDDFPQKLSHYSTGDVFEVFCEELIALAEGQTKFNSEIIVQDLAGRNRTLFLDLAVAPALERKLDRVLVSFIDITERKQAEEIMLARYRLVRRSLTDPLPDLLQATLDEVETLTDSNIGFFHFVAADQNHLSLQAWSTNTLRNMCNTEEADLHNPIDEAGVWADCVRERRPVIHNAYELLEHRKVLPEGHAEVERELIVPILRGDNIVGIIGVGNKETEYTRKDVETVTLLADLTWDIVERKQTEAALSESEALYHDLVETAQDLIWQCDRDGRYVYLNPAWEALFGYEPEKMLGKLFSDFQSPEFAERDKVVYENILEGEAVNNFETVHLGKDGQKIHLVFNAKAVRDEQGNVIGTRGTAYDITERKQAEEALRKNEYLLRESQKMAHIGHYDLDIVSGFWESSESLNHLFGIDWNYKTDVEGWLRVVHPDDRDDMTTYFTEEVIKNHQNFGREYRIKRISDGETRWVHGLGRLEFDSEGNPIHMLGSIQDITERKQADLALQESADRYRAVVENQTEFIVRWKPDGTRTFVNEAYLRYYDLTHDEALSDRFINLIFEKDRPAVKAKMSRLISGESHAETDIHRVIKSDGSIGWQEWTDHAIYDDQGNIIEFQSVGRDITERKFAEEALRESEERMRLLASATHEGIVFTEEGKVIEANEQLAQMLGCELPDLIGKSAMDFVAPESRPLVLEKIKSGAEELYEHLAMKKDGTIFPVEVRAQMMTVQGRKMRVTAILDVTERQRADELLSQERQRLANVIEGTNVGTWEWNVQTGETIFNERWAEIIGYSLDEISPVSIETWTGFAHPDDLKLSKDLLEKHFNGELDYYECEVRMRHKNGDWCWVLDRGKVAAWTNDGKPLIMSGTHQDITKRKQSELARLESERRFREVLENVQLIALSTDREGLVTFCNDYLLDLIGWKREELLGKNWFKTCLPPDVGPAVQTMFMESLERENVPSFNENEIQTKVGERRFVVWNNTMLRDIEGRVIGTSSIGEDITERKYAENALKSKTKELEALFSISSHLRSAQSADEMLPVVLAEMRRVLRSDANAVILLEADEAHFTFAISDGSLSANNGNQFEVENSISGLILQTRQPYMTKDYSTDPNKTTDLQGEYELGPAIFAPVISESEFIGVLLCARAKGDDARQFVESDVQLLTAIGEMVGNALRRARLYDQALTRLQHVQTLHSIDMAISANLDLSVILEVLLTQGAAQLDVDAASILLLNPHTHMLEFAAGNGFRNKNIKSANLRLGEGLPGQAAINRKVLHIRNLSNVDNLIRKYLLDEGFVSYQAAPLIAKGQLQGILEIFNRHPIEVGEEQLGFLETLATQAAIAIDNSQLFTDLQRSNFELEMAYDATIEGWSRALELRDQETEGHTLRVTDMTLQLAQNMGVRGGELTHIRRGALLHDIGKMGVPDRILLKPGELDEKEWEIMKMHAVYAFEMLWPIEFLRPAIDIPHCHHERWDGNGYPRGLKDEQIPLSARVFAVVDVWDALTNERPYRGPWSEEDTLEYITTNSGKHFDPRVVEKFLELLKSNSNR